MDFIEDNAVKAGILIIFIFSVWIFLIKADTADKNNECHQKNGVMVKTEFGYKCLKVEYAK